MIAIAQQTSEDIDSFKKTKYFEEKNSQQLFGCKNKKLKPEDIEQECL